MKNTRYKLISGILFFALLLTVLAYSGCVEEEKEEEPKNIVQTASANDDFDTLVEALITAGLDSALANESKEFTVFAPTDAAFSELESDYLTNLVQNDTDNLTKILTYHVLSGTVMSSDLSDGMSVETLQGKYVDITIDDGTVYVNDAEVTTADIECSNGVIHVIDTVLVPKDNIVEKAISFNDLNTLVDAVVAADLVDTLSDESAEYTVFAPTDVAFSDLDTEYLNNLINNDTANLTDILTYHVVPDIVYSYELSDNMTATTVQGSNITVQIINQSIYIDDAKVILSASDMECSNGVIHVIDKVILP